MSLDEKAKLCFYLLSWFTASFMCACVVVSISKVCFSCNLFHSDRSWFHLKWHPIIYLTTIIAIISLLNIRTHCYDMNLPKFKKSTCELHEFCFSWSNVHVTQIFHTTPRSEYTLSVCKPQSYKCVLCVRARGKVRVNQVQ